MLRRILTPSNQLARRLFASAASAKAPANSSAAAVAAAYQKPPQYLLNVPRLKETVLSNGFRVATEGGTGETASVAIFIDAGSAFETSETNGVAHFLEHMSFKGTNKRSRTDIEIEVENMGGQLNAYTSREQTVYYAQCLKDDVPKAVDILADIVQNSKLQPEHVEAERSVILQEKEQVESEPSEVLFDYLHAAAFQGSPLSRTILGPERNIKSIGVAELKHYIAAHYRPRRMALVGAGGVSHDALVEAANAAFGALPAGPAAPERLVAPFTGSEIRLRDDAMPFAHVAMAFESVGWKSADYFTLAVIQALVGQWSVTSAAGNNGTTRLAELVATEHLAHSFNCFMTTYNEIGLFGMHLVAEHEHLDDAVMESLQEFVRIAKNATVTEVERAKNVVKAAYLLPLDNTSTHVEEIGRQLISIGRRVSPAETWTRIDNVTAADVHRVATHYLTDTDLAVAAIGPINNLPDYNYLRNWTFQHRF